MRNNGLFATAPKPDGQARDSNLELLRIIAMLFVLMVHASFKALEAPTSEEIQNSPVSSFLRSLSEYISIISVNLFILITGWFGIRPKASRICGLFFQVFFIGIFIYLSLLLLGQTEPWGRKEWTNFFLIRRDNSLWFVESYLVLYIIAPVLNAFVSTAGKDLFRNVLVSFFAVQTYFGFFSPYSCFNNGYSTLSFIGLYLLARYMRIYPNRSSSFNKWHDMSIYLCATLLTTILSMAFGASDAYKYLYKYLSPLVIVSSVYFFLFFSKLSFHSKIVNWVAASAFAVYLFHGDPLFITRYYLLPIKYFYDNDSLPLFILHTTMLIIAVFLCSILVDKIRAYIWDRILSARHLISAIAK